MFDIGFSELLVIAVVALLVLGPERLPKAARFAGLWVRRARAQWYAVRSELETELADEEMRRSIQRTRDELREAQAELQQGGERLRAQLREVESQMTRPAGLQDTPSFDTNPADADVASLSADRSAGAPADAARPRDVHDADADVAASFHTSAAATAAPAPPPAIEPSAERPRDVG